VLLACACRQLARGRRKKARVALGNGCSAFPSRSRNLRGLDGGGLGRQTMAPFTAFPYAQEPSEVVSAGGRGFHPHWLCRPLFCAGRALSSHGSGAKSYPDRNLTLAHGAAGRNSWLKLYAILSYARDVHHSDGSVSARACCNTSAGRPGRGNGPIGHPRHRPALEVARKCWLVSSAGRFVAFHDPVHRECRFIQLEFILLLWSFGWRCVP